MNIVSILQSILNAASQGLFWGIMALGVYITFKILNFADMTCDGSFALGGCVTATMIAGLHWHPLLSLIVAALAGAAAGMITGILHTKLEIPAILSGILTMISLYSINLRIMGQANKPLNERDEGVETLISSIIKKLPQSLQANKNFEKYYVPIGIGLIFAVIIIMLLYWFFGTELGSSLRATGNNENMIRALGVDTDKMKILGLVLGNALVGLSGGMVVQQQRYADVGMGTGTIVIGLASIIIGEVIFGRARNFSVKLLAVVVGSVIYRIIVAVVLQLGLESSDLKLLTAIIVIIALSIPVLVRKKKGN